MALRSVAEVWLTGILLVMLRKSEKISFLSPARAQHLKLQTASHDTPIGVASHGISLSRRGSIIVVCFERAMRLTGELDFAEAPIPLPASRDSFAHNPTDQVCTQSDNAMETLAQPV